MLRLPVELQLRIVRLATNVPHLLDITPDPGDPAPPDIQDFDALVREFRSSLHTRRSLPLVSWGFNALCTPILYECIRLTPNRVRRICSTLRASPSKATMVQHLIFDVSARHREADLVALFSRLQAVRVLSVIANASVQESNRTTPYFSDTLASSMASNFGPSLRKLALHRRAVSTLLPQHAWDAFMAELVRLEAFVSTSLHSQLSLVSRFQAPSTVMSVPLPDSALPSLKYIHFDDASLQVPARVQPTHLHCPLPSLRHVTHTELAHLSLCVSFTLDDLLSMGSSVDPDFDIEDNIEATWHKSGAFATLNATAPNLVSLTLTGALISFADLLTKHPFPPTVSHLCFVSAASMFSIVASLGGSMALSAQAWVDALGGLPGSVRRVVIQSPEWVGMLRDRVEAGEVDVEVLQGCSFDLEDWEGHPVLPVRALEDVRFLFEEG
ncbi:hypothetical protein OF83DRAFT_1148393 [Amylostereum chailletii]|nr:hypothetical protein OF83DRAFT_1148393 [Amylostereum chailletii]